MDTWWMIAIACAVTIGMHLWEFFFPKAFLAFLNVGVHGICITALLIMGCSLEQSFVFILLSVAVQLGLRLIAQLFEEAKANSANLDEDMSQKE